MSLITVRAMLAWY